MKTLLIIPVFIAAALAVVGGLCHLCGLHPSGRDLVVAGAVAAGAAELAAAPMFIFRPTQIVAIWQLALLGTMIHMFAMVAGAILVLEKFSDGHSTSLPYWMILTYWISLAAVGWTMLGLAKAATAGLKSNDKTEVKAV